MAARLLLVAALLLWAPGADAATVTATSCSNAAVQTAISSAVDADSVQVPAGTCTWTATVTSSGRSISLLGAGIGNTTITSGAGVTNGVLLNVTTQATGNSPAGFFRVSGFTFVTGAGCNSNGFVTLGGASTNVRFDHNRLVVNTHGCGGLEVNTVYGVADHNTIDIPVSAIPVISGDLQGDTHGDESWAAPDTFGTAGAMYYEDNTITATTGSVNPVGTDGQRGARVVYRHNTFTDVVYSNHGTESGGRNRGIRSWEIYENDFWYQTTNPSTVASSRGGTGVIYNNRVHFRNGHTMNGFSLLQAFRRTPSPTNGAHPWCLCGAFSATSLTRSGSTATATTPGTFWASNAAAVFPNCWITVSNASNAAYNGTFQVTGTPSETQVQYTVVGTPPTPDPSGTITVRSAWDGNTDATGYRCMDQTGAGQSNVIHDSPPNSANPLPVGDIGNALTPVYLWGNTVETNGGTPSSVGGSSNQDVVVENRDFYNGTVKPGYVAYTYPHPLTAAITPPTPPPPPPPTPPPTPPPPSPPVVSGAGGIGAILSHGRRR